METWELIVTVQDSSVRQLFNRLSIAFTEHPGGWFNLNANSDQAIEVLENLPGGASIEFGGVWAGGHPEVTREVFEKAKEAALRTAKIRECFADFGKRHPEIGQETSRLGSATSSPAQTALKSVLKEAGGRLPFDDAICKAYKLCGDYPHVGIGSFESVIFWNPAFTLEGDELVLSEFG